MKSLVLYYTFGGSTKLEAEKIAAEQEVPVYRVREKRNRSLIGLVYSRRLAGDEAQKNENLAIGSRFVCV